MSAPFTPRPGVAWLVILASAALMMTLANLPDGSGDTGAGVSSAHDTTLEFQVKLVLASEALAPGSGEAEVVLNPQTGTIGHGLRVLAAWAAMEGPEAARQRLATWRAGLSDRGMTPNAGQQALIGHLDRVLAGMANDGVMDSVESELGWFGRLAVASSEGTEKARRAALQPIIDAGVAMLAVVTAFTVVLGVVGFVGLIGLIVAAIFALNGRIRSGVAQSPLDGVYAETCALWIIAFQVLSIPAAVASAVLSEHAPDLILLPGVCALFLSVTVLYWPVFRGLTWSQVRRDVGLTSGRGVLVEVGCGLAGYAMALPIVLVGILITVVLFMLASEGPGGSSAAHPITGQVKDASALGIVMIFLLASVAAPVVEEIMFRGLLYRQVRTWLALRAGDTSPFLWFCLVVMPSALVTSAVFAAIHPQGVLAIPALMALAIAFCLAREWRGSLISPMVMHGLSNGVVMTMLVLMPA